VLALVALAALVGGRFWRYGYSEITPEFSTPPSWTHPMGTDGVGHDGLAQVLRGAQKSLQVGLLAALVSTTLGAIVGMAAGYYRGWVDPVLMRFTDLILTIPGIAILIVMAGRVRGTRGNWWAIALIVAVLSWPGTARMVRAMVLSLREKEFVEAARAIGAGTWRIMVHHLLPHAAGPIIVRATFAVGGAIFAETGLSYLGLGISPPDTSLGSLVGTGQAAATTRPWLFYFPGLFIALIVLSVNLVGDGLRDALDPRGDRHVGR
jgi:peptide/nickel transport system permease protein